MARNVWYDVRHSSQIYLLMNKRLRYDTPLRIICALLFATFSFLYIYMFQGELLALIQDYLSQGQTTNNTLVTASVVTLLMMSLQYLLNRVGKLHGYFEALSYLPSCVLLALITKVDAAYAYSWVTWTMGLSVVTLVYMLVVWLERNTFVPRDSTFFRMLTPNLIFSMMLFVFVGWYGNNSPVSKMELSAWKYVHVGQYDKVLTVGANCDDCNADLTALRNLALAKTGKLANRLFAYPQPYGSDGLLMNRYHLQTPQYGSKAYYDILGSTPYGGEKAAAFYKRMAQKTDSVYYADLYEAALLLDKDLDTFVDVTTEKGYPKTSRTNIPIHTQEAWMIYNEQHPFHPITFVPDDAVIERYQQYLTLRDAHIDDPVVMRNLCKRRFGKTYWYYYDFVD